MRGRTAPGFHFHTWQQIDWHERTLPRTLPASHAALWHYYAPMLLTRGLGKDHGALTAVKALDLEIATGEFFGLLGPNGAGKSTTIGMLCGVMTPTRGSATVGGHDVVRAARAARMLLGYVPQDLALYEELTARQNLRYFGRLYGLHGSELAGAVDAALALSDLATRADEPVSRFSGGMKRRLNLAAGTLHSPKLLVCDEPTVGVDPQSRAHIFEALKRMNAAGMTVLYTSHYMEEVEALCTRIGVMDHGVLVACDTLDGLLHAHAPGGMLLQVRGDTQLAVAALPQSAGARVLAKGVWVRDGADLATLAVALQSAGVPLLAATPLQADLEEVFLKLTGHALRDAA